MSKNQKKRERGKAIEELRASMEKLMLRLDVERNERMERDDIRNKKCEYQMDEIYTILEMERDQIKKLEEEISELRKICNSSENKSVETSTSSNSDTRTEKAKNSVEKGGDKDFRNENLQPIVKMLTQKCEILDKRCRELENQNRNLSRMSQEFSETCKSLAEQNKMTRALTDALWDTFKTLPASKLGLKSASRKEESPSKLAFRETILKSKQNPKNISTKVELASQCMSTYEGTTSKLTARKSNSTITVSCPLDTSRQSSKHSSTREEPPPQSASSSKDATGDSSAEDCIALITQSRSQDNSTSKPTPKHSSTKENQISLDISPSKKVPSDSSTKTYTPTITSSLPQTTTSSKPTPKNASTKDSASQGTPQVNKCVSDSSTKKSTTTLTSPLPQSDTSSKAIPKYAPTKNSVSQGMSQSKKSPSDSLTKEPSSTFTLNFKLPFKCSKNYYFSNEHGDPSLDSMLLFAAECCAGGQVRNLLEAGANPNARAADGDHALHIACGHGNIGAVRLLLEAGASVNAPGDHAMTPLHVAASSGHADALAELLRCGANVEARTTFSSTPLQLAAYSDAVQCVRLLLEAGADPHAKKNDGSTAEIWASSPQVLELLRRYM